LTAVEELRRFYAEIIVADRRGYGERLVDAFARVPRELFVGPGPWDVHAGDRYVRTPTADLAFVYQDQLIALDGARSINNGHPSSHALWLAALAPNDGDHVVHVGAGTGYYTAVLRELVGSTGTVVAFEIDASLAARAASNLAHAANVTVLRESAIDASIPACDALYVNASVTDLPDTWLDALRVGGRLLAPLTPKRALGGMLLVTREAVDRFAARFVSGANFISCVGAMDDAASERLAVAFARGENARVRSLCRHAPADGTCWYAGARWWLSTAPPGEGARKL
jgi:protein-L-isoaspartate(D-aspartate) O-methyltransferase